MASVKAFQNKADSFLRGRVRTGIVNYVKIKLTLLRNIIT